MCLTSDCREPRCCWAVHSSLPSRSSLLNTPTHPSGSGIRSELTGVTDANGKFQFLYIPSEVSGTDTIKVEAPNNPGLGSNSKEIVVGVAGLNNMEALPGPQPFVFFGDTPQHQLNHFALQRTIDKLDAAASKYLNDQANDPAIASVISALTDLGYDFPFPADPRGNADVVPRGPEPLFVNDISLPFGGMFDVGDSDAGILAGNYSSPHGGHRSGRNVDLKSLHLVSGSPYFIFRGQVTVEVHNIRTDSRLVGALQPFRDSDSYLTPTGRRINYSAAIRFEMQLHVKTIHYRRLTLLIDALKSVGATFAPEGNHIHVGF